MQHNQKESFRAYLLQMRNQIDFMLKMLDTNEKIKKSPNLKKIHSDIEEDNLSNFSKGDLMDLVEKTKIDLENQKVAHNLITGIEKNKRKNSMDLKLMPKKMDIYKIVLTGGPCAGKTTAITTIADKLRENGFAVLNVPEAATMIFSSGAAIHPDKYSTQMSVQFQYFLLMLQMSLEDIFAGIAAINAPDKDIVLICDRGTMDGSAYISKEIWETILHDYDLNETKIRDKRYDLVIHLSTAADGAEKFYSLNNNIARSEGIKEAIDIDRKLQEVWIDHPNFVQINNRRFKTFKDKIDEVNRTVFKFLGLPTTLTFYKKYIVANPDKKLMNILKENLAIKVHEFDISDVIFFKGEKELIYYRKRKSKNVESFTKCEKSLFEGIFKEKRRQVSYREYASMKKLDSDKKYYLKKKRSSFMWNQILYIIDTMEYDGIFFSVCVIQGYKETVSVKLPEIIYKNLIKEVPKDVVDIFTENVAKGKDIKKFDFSDEMKESMKTFKSK